MKILHISDTHGKFLDYKEKDQADIIVHSGDMLETFSFDRETDLMFQEEHILEKNIIDQYRNLITKPFFFCPGNHDRLSPSYLENYFRLLKLDFTNISFKVVEYNGIKMIGFPFLNPINGFWEYECVDELRRQHIHTLINVLKNNKIDILVCHAPLYSILDRAYGENLGDKILLNELDKLDEKYLPKLMLHGHIHEAPGVSKFKNMLISNAATTSRLIECDFC